jgi:large subunit ribosomal protein L17
MRHQNSISKLGKTPAHRRAMLRNMVTSLFRHERIQTTQAKAKVAQSYAERMITFGKKGDLHARRMAARFINDETVLKKLFTEIAPSFAERNGGYTRVLRTGPRSGDKAEMAILELVTKTPARPKKVANRKTAARLAPFSGGGKLPRRKPKPAAAPEADTATAVAEAEPEGDDAKA